MIPVMASYATRIYVCMYVCMYVFMYECMYFFFNLLHAPLLKVILYALLCVQIHCLELAIQIIT